MARNKMEKEFAHKLNAREIQPSAAAWDRLDAMLTATEAQPARVKRNNTWLYIAAGFLGMLLATALFFQQQRPQLGNWNSGDGMAGAETKRTEIPADPQVQSNPNVRIAQESEKIKSVPAPVHRIQVRKPVPAEKIPSVRLAENVNHHQSNSIANQKTNTSIPTEDLASAATADELLAAAQARRQTETKRVTVNARSLLSEVDAQAEEKLTLRQKAIRALNKNYQHVKVAVENRNLEESH